MPGQHSPLLALPSTLALLCVRRRSQLQHRRRHCVSLVTQALHRAALALTSWALLLGLLRGHIAACRCDPLAADTPSLQACTRRVTPAAQIQDGFTCSAAAAAGTPSRDNRALFTCHLHVPCADALHKCACSIFHMDAVATTSCCGMAAATGREPWQRQDSWTIQSKAEDVQSMTLCSNSETLFASHSTAQACRQARHGPDDLCGEALDLQCLDSMPRAAPARKQVRQ